MLPFRRKLLTALLWLSALGCLAMIVRLAMAVIGLNEIPDVLTLGVLGGTMISILSAFLVAFPPWPGARGWRNDPHG